MRRSKLNFTAPQSHIKLFVGFSAPLTIPTIVVLRAFASNGTLVRQAKTTLPVNAQPTDIRTALEVSSTTANIVRVDIDVEDSSGNAQFTNGLAVNNLNLIRPVRHRRVRRRRIQRWR